MTVDTIHPDLRREQAYVERAYACMSRMLEEVAAFGTHGRNDFERESFERWKAARMAALSDTVSALVFGRIDLIDDETHYIGRHSVRDHDYETVVVDWRADIARSFYQASVRDPMGVRRRRHFLVEGREILGISDDDLHDDGLRGVDVLERELERQRGGRMRDIVSTIQAEQDAIIRAPLEGVVAVQGGPGTGKTAIGLHRAAFLLYEHRRTLQRRGVLVVGPNPVFIEYIAQVLPSLGESAVTQVPVDALAPSVRVVGADDPGAARLKGDVRMAEVLRRALADRRRELDGDVHLAHHGLRFAVTAAEISDEAASLRARGVPHRKGRELLRDTLLVRAYRAYAATGPAEAAGASFEDVVSAVRRDRGFRAALDRAWPAVTAEALVGELLASPSRLARAADGILSAPEQRLIRRRGRESWTAADRPLLDEAEALIEGPPDHYGHIVVDEAQDLSPLQLRMLARRCPEASMTILGDLGQATGVWAHDHWDEVLGELPGPPVLEELTLGYRVGAAIMDVAAAILRQAAPGLRAPRAVRREAGRIRIERTSAASRGAAVASAAREMVDRLGAAAVIVPDGLGAEIASALRDAGLEFGDADRQGLTHPLTLVGALRAKGLEFEGVVVVEPSAIVEEGSLRLLYVAVTRAMRDLVIVHADDLPVTLASPTRSE